MSLAIFLMCVAVNELKKRMDTVRTQYGKALKKPSGSPGLTKREQFVLDHCDFLQPYMQSKRGSTSSLKISSTPQKKVFF